MTHDIRNSLPSDPAFSHGMRGVEGMVEFGWKISCARKTQAGTVIARVPNKAVHRRAVGQNDLGTPKYVGPWKSPTLQHDQHSSLQFWQPTLVRMCCATGNGIASKVLNCENPTISADRWPWWKPYLRYSTVGPNRIAGRSPPAFLPLMAFPLAIAYPRRGADPSPCVFRNLIAYHARP